MHYTSASGLISNEAFHILRDSRGYIWVATELGVSRYNGYEFENFDVGDGLPDQVILKLQEDAQGKIWFFSFSGALAYYHAGRIYPYKYNDLILSRAYAKKYPPKIFIGEQDSVFVNLFNNERFLITPNGLIVENQPPLKEEPIFRHSFILDAKKTRLHETLIRNAPDKKVDSVDVLWQGHRIILPFGGSPYVNLTAHYTQHNSLYIAFTHTIAEFDSLEHISYQHYAFNITVCKSLSNGEFAIGTQKGLYIYDHFDSTQYKYFLLDNKRITGITEDHSGGIWIATLNSGIYYIPNNGLLTYNNPATASNVKISAMMTFNNELIVGFENGAIQQLDPHTATWSPILPADGLRIYDITTFDDQIFVVGTNKMRYISLKDKGKTNVHEIVGKCAVKSGDSVLFIAGLTMLKYTKTSSQMRSVVGRIEYLAPYQQGKHYAGNGWGLWEVDLDADTVSATKTAITTPVSDLEQWGDILIVCTKGNGIQLLKHDTVKQLSTENYLSSNNIRAVELYNDQLWVVHEKGIDVIELDSATLDVQRTINLEKIRDLPATNVTSLLIDEERVWLGTEADLYSIAHNYKSDVTTYAVPFINAVTLNDSVISGDHAYPPDQNNFSAQFISLDYQSHGLIKYRYRLLGLDTVWRITANREINYTGLPAGEYTLEVDYYDEADYNITGSTFLKVTVFRDFGRPTQRKNVYTLRLEEEEGHWSGRRGHQ